MTDHQAPEHRPLLARIFLSRPEHRLRAGWRLLLQAMLQIAFTILAALVLLLALGGAAERIANLNSGSGLAVAELGEVVTVTLSVFIARRLLDNRSFVSLGLRLDRRALSDVLAGIGIAFAVMGLIFVAEFSLGWLTLSGYAWPGETPTQIAGGVLIFGAIFVVVGWNEELMSRGYHLQTIASGLTLLWGLLVSSAIFGALHLGNPHATWVSAVGIFCAGIFLGYAYLRTLRLWLSIGLHIGWNFFEGVVFGFPVSGLTFYRLVHTSISGPEIWTGGAFGPEAGLIVLPAIAVGMVLVHLYTNSRRPNEETN
jgi:membrane protease YdiL (CAAX protease family)